MFILWSILLKIIYLQQMFDFLNKLSHQHPSPSPELIAEAVNFEELESSDQDKQLQRSESENQSHIKYNSSKHYPPKKKYTLEISDKIQKKAIKRGESIVGKMQIIEKIQLNPKIMSIFSGALAQSERQLSNILSQKLKKTKTDRQRKVYIREMAHNQQEYLSQAGKSTQVQSLFLQQGLEITVNNIIDQISKEIEIQNLPIKMKRKRYQDAEEERKIETMKLIRMRENQLQGKIGELAVQFDFGEEAAERRAQQMLNKDQFDPDSIKTKIAQEFVKEKQREREEKKQKIQEYREKKRTMQLQTKQVEQERLQRMKQEKHQRLMRQFAQKQRLKKEQQEKAKQQQHQYKQFLKEYKQSKPLYQIKEEQYQNKLKQQKKQRYYILKEKQAKFQPLNVQMLEMHQERYQELRREDRERKQAELDLAKQKEFLLKKQLDEKIYKGKFRYIVLKEMADAQAKKREKQAEKQAILMKKHAYSLEVKQYHKPTVDPTKRQEIQQIIGSHKQRKRKFMTPNRVAYSEQYSTISSSQNYHHPYSEPEIDPKKQGEKYHRLFKQYIRNKIERGQVKSDDQQNDDKITITKKPDYLKELRQKYEGRIPSKSSRLQKQIQKMRQGEDYRGLILKAQEFDNKAKRRQVKLRNVAHVPEEEAKLEEDYLCAIKAKMQLISNMD